MLQFIAEKNERYSIPELAQMAIEGGCKWIILRMPDDDDAEIREVVEQLVPLCKETSTILTIENHIEMARELGLHGVHLCNCPKPALSVREELGPEAIIGVEVGDASSVMALQAADVDYVTFPIKLTLERISENIEALRNSHSVIPVVVEGDFTAQNVGEALLAGANGIAVSRSIADASDPVRAAEELLEALGCNSQAE